MPKPELLSMLAPMPARDYERSGYKFKPGDLVHLVRGEPGVHCYDALKVSASIRRCPLPHDDKILSIGRDDILIIVAYYAQPGFADELPAWEHRGYHAMVNECLVWIDDIWFKKYDEDANET